MTPEAADYLEKAREDLADARKVASISLARVAARLAYYAAFHAAEALIVDRSGKTPKTHSGVRAELGRLLKDEPGLGARRWAIWRALTLLSRLATIQSVATRRSRSSKPRRRSKAPIGSLRARDHARSCGMIRARSNGSSAQATRPSLRRGLEVSGFVRYCMTDERTYSQHGHPQRSGDAGRAGAARGGGGTPGRHAQRVHEAHRGAQKSSSASRTNRSRARGRSIISISSHWSSRTMSASAGRSNRPTRSMRSVTAWKRAATPKPISAACSARASAHPTS